MRWLVVRTALIALALSAIAPSTLPATAATRAAGRAPRFAVRCLFSHRLSDDPIVFPGVPDAAHSHDFFGNTTTNAATTPESLHAGGTTCTREADRSAYWVPTLYKGGTAVKAEASTLYYQGVVKPRSSITVFPAGFRMIAGDAEATSRQRYRVAQWQCRLPGQANYRVSEPQCPDAAQLILRIGFPDCWDGVLLDSTDHKSHMAYSRMAGSRRMECPPSHPVAMPAINMFVIYKTSGGPNVSLSSGSGLTAHADFFNGWDQETQSRLIAGCIHAKLMCNTRDDPLAP
jgi:hypothetical protein